MITAQEAREIALSGEKVVDEYLEEIGVAVERAATLGLTQVVVKCPDLQLMVVKRLDDLGYIVFVTQTGELKIIWESS